MLNPLDHYRRVVYPTEKVFVKEGLYSVAELEKLVIVALRLSHAHAVALDKSMKETDAVKS